MDLRVEGIHIFTIKLTEEDKNQLVDIYVPRAMDQDSEDEEAPHFFMYPNAIDTQKLQIISQQHVQHEEYQRIYDQYSKEMESLQKSLN